MSKKTVVIKATFSVAFFFVLFSVIREKEFASIFYQIDPFFFTLCLLLPIVMIPSSCLKWKILLEQQGKRVNFLFLLKAYLIGYFFSNLMPSNVGGDVVRSYYIGRHIGSQSQAAVSVFIERFTGIFLLLVLAILAPLMKLELYKNLLVILPACGAFTLLIAIAWIWKIKEPLKFPDKITRTVFYLIRKTNRALRINTLNKMVDQMERYYGKVFCQAESFHEKLLLSVSYIRSNRLSLLSVAALTVFFYSMTWVNVYMAFRAFGVEVDFIEISALIPTSMVVAMIPVTLLGNLGFTESVYIAFFSLIGVSSSAILFMGLLLRLKLFVIGIVGYFFYLMYRHKQLDIAELERLSGEKT